MFTLSSIRLEQIKPQVLITVHADVTFTEKAKTAKEFWQQVKHKKSYVRTTSSKERIFESSGVLAERTSIFESALSYWRDRKADRMFVERGAWRNSPSHWLLFCPNSIAAILIAVFVLSSELHLTSSANVSGSEPLSAIIIDSERV